MMDKKCGDCCSVLPLDEFSLDHRNRDGRGPYCRSCQNKRQNTRRRQSSPEDLEAKKRYERAWHHSTKERRARSIKSNRLKTRYGITLEDYERMLNEQRERCAICEEEKELVVDHDHATGEVRGLLCRSCNFQLGIVEQAEWLAKAFRYLKIRDQ
jgi:hypothetical protein